MIFCKFGDFIKIKKSNKFLFSIEGPFSENLSTNQNIIIDTVSLLENFFGMKFNIEIVLKKIYQYLQEWEEGLLMLLLFSIV